MNTSLRNLLITAVFLLFNSASLPLLAMPNSLPLLIENAKKNHSSRQVSRYQVERAALNSSQVSAEFGPRLKARLGLGPITKSTGNALSSVQDNSDFGVAYLGSVDLTIPIYAWGRKSALNNASEQGLIAAQQKSEDEWLKSVFEIKEAYYGFLFAKSLADFIKENKETLSGILENFKKKKRSKKDIYKLEVVLAQVDGKFAEIEAAKKNAALGLAYRSGHKLDERMDDKDLWLSPRKRSIAELKYYQQRFLQEHPKLKLIEAGSQAKSELAKSEDRSRWPVFAVLAKYDFASTNQREKQNSVFANDPYNRSDMVLGLGFEWDFQFSLHSVKRDQYLAEKMQLQSQGRQARLGMAALVEKARNDLVSAEQRLAAARRGHKAAKKLWSRSAMSWSAGLGKSDEIQSAFTTKAFAAKDYYEAIFAYEVAWAGLSRAVGVEIDPHLLKSEKMPVN